MKKDVWKVRTILGHEMLFEQLCEKGNIYCKSYPKPIEGVYRVECPKDKLLDIGYCIATIEEMPIICLS